MKKTVAAIKNRNAKPTSIVEPRMMPTPIMVCNGEDAFPVGATSSSGRSSSNGASAVGATGARAIRGGVLVTRGVGDAGIGVNVFPAMRPIVGLGAAATFCVVGVAFGMGVKVGNPGGTVFVAVGGAEVNVAVGGTAVFVRVAVATGAVVLVGVAVAETCAVATEFSTLVPPLVARDSSL